MEFEERADELEAQAEDLGHASDKLEDQIEETKRDWEGKKADSSVPGAVEDAQADAPAPGQEGPPADDSAEPEQGDQPPRSGEQSEAGQ